MKNPVQERLDAIRRELEAQDQTWRRAKESLARLGDLPIPVPREVLEQLEAPVAPTAAPPVGGVRA
jgi:hypothetical protein